MSAGGVTSTEGRGLMLVRGTKIDISQSKNDRDMVKSDESWYKYLLARGLKIE